MLISSHPAIGLLLVLLVGSSASAYSEEKNLAYIGRILDLLNNNLECQLPTYAEVDELERSFAELEASYGPQFESRLSNDHNLLRRTLLKHWSSFQKRMTSAVVIRSAKKRAFLGKVEDYQRAKFGDSVCSRFKDSRGPITDKIFETNPIVRYIKHLETKEVIEWPEGEEQVGGVEQQPVVDVPSEPPAAASETEVATEPSTIVHVSEPSTIEPIEPDFYVEPPTEALAEFEPGPPTEFPAEPEPEIPAEPKIERPVARVVGPTTERPSELIVVELEPEVATEAPLGASRRPAGPLDVYGHKRMASIIEEDQDPEPGVTHRLVGKFTVDLRDKPQNLMLRFDSEHHDDNDRDPLADIPVPPSDNQQLENDRREDEAEQEDGVTVEPEVATQPEPEPETITTPEPTTTTSEPKVKFDPSGAQLIEVSKDDANLDKLAHLPPTDWEFDPIYGYFKWPDEGHVPTNDELDDRVQEEWDQFTADPVAYDHFVESSTEPPIIRPKLNPAAMRRRKKELLRSLVEESEHQIRQTKLHWINHDRPDTIPERGGPIIMPEIKRDRWINVADNNMCKVDYNKDYIKNTSKRGFKAVRSLFSSNNKDPFKTRKHMLGGQ